MIKDKEIEITQVESLQLEVVLSKLDALAEGILRREIQSAKIMDDAEKTVFNLSNEIRILTEQKSKLKKEKLILCENIKNTYNVDLTSPGVECDFVKCKIIKPDVLGGKDE